VARYARKPAKRNVGRSRKRRSDCAYDAKENETKTRQLIISALNYTQQQKLPFSLGFFFFLNVLHEIMNLLKSLPSPFTSSEQQ
jgi:hypothetical protein